MYRIIKSGSGIPEDANKAEVLIQSVDDLDDLPETLSPGSTAYKADLSLLYMKDLDGSWKQIGGE